MRELLREYLNREGVSANRLAQEAGVGQPTVSRFLTGRTKSVTPAMARALSYAGISRPLPIIGIRGDIDNPSLRAALERNWDGTQDGAVALAALIDAVGPLLRTMRASPATGRSK